MARKRTTRWADLNWLAHCPVCGWEDHGGDQHEAQATLFVHLRQEHSQDRAEPWAFCETADHVTNVVRHQGGMTHRQEMLPLFTFGSCRI